MTLVRLGLDINLHRSELDDHEASPSISDPFLPEENRPRGSDLNPESNKDHDGQPEGQAEQNAANVEYTFPERAAGGMGHFLSREWLWIVSARRYRRIIKRRSIRQSQSQRQCVVWCNGIAPHTGIERENLLSDCLVRAHFNSFHFFGLKLAAKPRPVSSVTTLILGT